jgi:hypothetical protein
MVGLNATDDQEDQGFENVKKAQVLVIDGAQLLVERLGPWPPD